MPNPWFNDEQMDAMADAASSIPVPPRTPEIVGVQEECVALANELIVEKKASIPVPTSSERITRGTPIDRLRFMSSIEGEAVLDIADKLNEMIDRINLMNEVFL